MLIKTAMVLVAQLSFGELESAWWDCDVRYQQDRLINREYIECKKIDDTFRVHFPSETVFLQYWHDAKKEQWAKRGYKPE
jgi:hypothetical protein